jgi:hypothetical protein
MYVKQFIARGRAKSAAKVVKSWIGAEKVRLYEILVAI